MKILRYTKDNQVVAILERLTGCGGTPDFWTCHVYERGRFGQHGGRTFIDTVYFGDIAYRHAGKEEKNHKDAYKLINELFPEIAPLGLKSGGHCRYTVEEVDKVFPL